MTETQAKASLERKMNDFGASRTPFFFMLDFEGHQSIVRPLSDLRNLQYTFHNAVTAHLDIIPHVEVYPPDINEYEKAYEIVQRGLSRGDSYLVNLTFKNYIETNLSLDDMYRHSKAKYKLYIPNELAMFSPETFVSIRGNTISSFPMKGTISSSVANAREVILSDKKEFAEHSTIVDLIRNDLSIVSNRVSVSKWRYIEDLPTPTGSLLQVSSQIDGQLDTTWNQNVGTIISKLLPAGSISGAPKKKTLEIIRHAENRDRGWYTGVCGVFDGVSLDSAVMIRMVTQENDAKYFHSGGGITAMSDLRSEHQELQDKIYVPISRDHQSIERSDISSYSS